MARRTISFKVPSLESIRRTGSAHNCEGFTPEQQNETTKKKPFKNRFPEPDPKPQFNRGPIDRGILTISKAQSSTGPRGHAGRSDLSNLRVKRLIVEKGEPGENENM